MKVCPDCRRSMVRYDDQGEVIFQCHCGQVVKGDDWDSLVHTKSHQAQEVTAMYSRLISNASRDPANQQVKKDCPLDCGRDYMTQVRVGLREVVVYTCVCGYVSDGFVTDGPAA